MHRSLCSIAALALAGVCAGSVLADEVLFKNGDRISGKIERMEDGKLVIRSKVAGEIKVDPKDIKTFSTDEPVELHLTDGTVLKQKVTSAPEGEIRTVPAAATAPAAPGAAPVAPPLPAQTVKIASVEKLNPPPVKWTGEVLVGALLSRGNTDTDNINASLNLSRRSESDRITAGASYMYGRQRDPDTGKKQTTTDNWFVTGKYDYFFTKKLYGYGQGRVERDRIAELDLRLITGIGGGYQWVEKPDFNFSTEAGVSWLYEDYSNDTEANDFMTLRLAHHVDKAINDKVKLFHNMEIYPGFEDPGDFFLTADGGIRASLTKQMFTEFKVQWNYDATPAEGASKNDLRYIASVGFSF